jgi:putative SOS response-associated peptidase YedK
MCYYTEIKKDEVTIAKKLKKSFKDPELFSPEEQINGFATPKTPVTTIENPDLIEMITWGFPTEWGKPLLNAKIETLYDLKSFKNYTDNRCLIIVDGFYEWRHEGKNKIKYNIGFEGEIFTLAGIFKYVNEVPYYTIVTTEAQGIMREIHNTKLRMPFALNSEEKQNQWLHNEPVEPDWDFVAQMKN